MRQAGSAPFAEPGELAPPSDPNDLTHEMALLSPVSVPAKRTPTESFLKGGPNEFLRTCNFKNKRHSLAEASFSPNSLSVQASPLLFQDAGGRHCANSGGPMTLEPLVGRHHDRRHYNATSVMVVPWPRRGGRSHPVQGQEGGSIPAVKMIPTYQVKLS